MNSIQDGLALNVLVNVWIPRLVSDVPARGIDTKTQIVGLTRLLTDTPDLLQDDNGRQLWASTVATIMSLLTNSVAAGSEVPEDDSSMEIEISSDASFSRLFFARRPVEDPFADVADPSAAFARVLHQLSMAHPGQLQSILQQLDPKIVASVNALLQQAGLHLA
jgi:hypothetical protein